MAKGTIAQSKIDALLAKRAKMQDTLKPLVDALNDPYGTELGLITRIDILRARIQEIDGFLEMVSSKEKEPEKDASPELIRPDGELQPYVSGGPIPDGGDLPPAEQAL